MDLDGDGRRDVITGSWPGRIYWFGGEAAGGFARGIALRHHTGAEIAPGNASAAFAADWNGDGLRDLLVGTIDGAIVWLPRIAGDAMPTFGVAVPLEVGGEPLSVGNDGAPVVADWDQDGNADLLVGDGFGAVQWFRNLGTSAPPKLADPQILLARPMVTSRPAPGSLQPQRGARAKFCVTDWNEDGHLDLLVGEFGSRPGGNGTAADPERHTVLRARQSQLHAEIERAEHAPEDESAAAREERLLRRDQLCAEWGQLDEELSLIGGSWLGRVILYQRLAPTSDAGSKR